MRNRYLLSKSGTWLGDRVRPFLFFLGPVLASPFVMAIDAFAQVGVFVLLGILMLFLGVILGWVFLVSGSRGVREAGEHWFRGETAIAISKCQSALATVFRSDVRTKALHVLGLTAEANGDFPEALDLFDRVLVMMPMFGTASNKQRAQVLVQSHRALCLVAQGRLPEADAAVRMASALFATPTSNGLTALFDDEAFGTMGVNQALAQLEPMRDPRALLSLATIVLLEARGMPREALDVLARERMTIGRSLFAREVSLLRGAEARALRALGGGGAHRAPELPEEIADPWAARVLRS